MKHPLPVTLPETERASLQTFIHAGKANARTFTRARVLLKAAEGWTDQANLRCLRHQPQYLHSCATSVSGRRIGGGAARQATSAISPSLNRRTGGPSDRHHVQSRSHWPRPLDRPFAGRQSRRAGFCRVYLTRNHSPVAQKNELKPWQHEQWCIPAVGAEFVAAMEDVLDLYEEEYDPRYPTVCFDEKLVAPEADVRPPESMEPGSQSGWITRMSAWAPPICFSSLSRFRAGVMWR